MISNCEVCRTLRKLLPSDIPDETIEKYHRKSEIPEGYHLIVLDCIIEELREKIG